MNVAAQTAGARSDAEQGSILTASSLRYAYRGVPAATDIGFTIGAGSITALIGANG
ncbi:MAG: hypothetical protein JWR08_1399, partial [Enterovirga sp.]|nr:hypothetical protein [Enterovirga sp.]